MKNKSFNLIAGLVAGAALFLSGCATESLPTAGANGKEGSALIILREGDVVKISFPSSANLVTTRASAVAVNVSPAAKALLLKKIVSRG